MRILAGLILFYTTCLCDPMLMLSQAHHEWIKNPAQLAGPWEFADRSGVHGIFIEMETRLQGPAGHGIIINQESQIEVYHRYLGKTREGWFATLEARSGASSISFGGTRLQIHFVNTTELDPFDMNLTFHPDAQNWTGVWRWNRRTQNVILTRPHARGEAIPCSLCGDWKGQQNSSDGRFRFTPGSLYIYESSDGAFVAWLDRTTSAFDPTILTERTYRRDGEELQVVSMENGAIVLETESAIAPVFRYSGKLSFGHLEGKWGSESGENLAAPNDFVRAR